MTHCELTSTKRLNISTRHCDENRLHLTVLRYVHDIATGEFVNVGVVIYAREARYASALCRATYGRLSKVFPGLDGEAFKGMMHYVQSRIEELGSGLRDELALEGLPASVTDLAQSVLPRDDSSLQWSPPGSGLSDDPSRTPEALFDRLVSSYDERPAKERRTDEEVWLVREESATEFSERFAREVETHESQ